MRSAGLVITSPQPPPPSSRPRLLAGVGRAFHAALAVIHRVLVVAVLPDLIVYVRAAAAAGGPHETDHVAALDDLALGDVELLHMAVGGGVVRPHHVDEVAIGGVV